MKKSLIIITLLIFVLSLTGCKQNNKSPQKPAVAVSIAPQATFLEKICGDTVSSVTMIPAGASAENYELTPKEITAFAGADIYFTIGIPAEENGILPNIPKTTKIVDLAEKVDTVYPCLTVGDERDPHIWLSPKRAIVMVKAMKEELSSLLPENSAFYSQNAKNYIEELEALDRQIKATLKESANKSFFIFHPAYGYFADDYSLNMIALEEHGHEATAKELATLTDKALSLKIKTVFCQEEAAIKQAQTFAKEIGARVEILKPLSPDYINELQKTATLMKESVR